MTDPSRRGRSPSRAKAEAPGAARAATVAASMVRDVAACRPDDSLNEAANLMWRRDCGFVPVVADEVGRTLVGVVTDRDIAMTAFFRGQSLKEIAVSAAMSPPTQVAHPDDDLEAALERMRRAQVHRLPVVDAAGRLVGVLSLADVLRRKGVAPGRLVGTLAAIRTPRDAPEV